MTIFFCALGLVVAIGWFFFRVRQDEKRKKLLQQGRKAAYELSLMLLSDNPKDVNLRIKCLDAGREYYSCALPDTYDLDGNGNRSNYRDNTAAREARIQADIEARVSHLKIAG